jgi:hypothetical protein
MAFTLPVGSTLLLNNNALSEHNRAPISISTNRIEQTNRMSNGSLRKYFVADKLNISVSWSQLPSRASATVDTKYGALDIKDFYDSATGQGSFTVTVKHANNTTLYEKTMIFTSCNFEMVRRNAKVTPNSTPQELWNVSITLEEV